MGPLQSPDRVQLCRRPEREEGQTGLTQTVRRGLTYRLPGRNARAPTFWRGGPALERQRAVRAPLVHGMSVTPFNGFAKDEKG